MKIISIALVSTNILAIGYEKDGEEGVFYIAAPTEYLNEFADALAAVIVHQRLLEVK